MNVNCIHFNFGTNVLDVCSCFTAKQTKWNTVPFSGLQDQDLEHILQPSRSAIPERNSSSFGCGPEDDYALSNQACNQTATSKKRKEKYDIKNARWCHMNLIPVFLVLTKIVLTHGVKNTVQLN